MRLSNLWMLYQGSMSLAHRTLVKPVWRLNIHGVDCVSVVAPWYKCWAIWRGNSDRQSQNYRIGEGSANFDVYQHVLYHAQSAHKQEAVKVPAASPADTRRCLLCGILDVLSFARCHNPCRPALNR